MTRAAEPLTLAHGPSWRNRVALAPMTNQQSHPDGSLSLAEIEWLLARGKGGFGHIMTAAAYVADSGRTWPGGFGVSSDDFLPGMTRLAESIRETGATSSVQLHHGGRRARLGGGPGLCPWDDAEHGTTAMTTSDVERFIADYVAAAVRAERAGFDGVALHSAHGYLLAQFLHGTLNQRDDGYGRSREGRIRPLMEIIAGIRAATGPDFQLGVRLTPEGFGLSLDDAVWNARCVLDSGLVDHLDLSMWDVYMKPRKGADGLLIDHYMDLPRGITRLGVTGLVRKAADVQWCLDKGADWVSVGKAAIARHDFAARALVDPTFEVSLPVAPTRLLEEKVSPAFLDYLAVRFDDVVAFE